MLPPLTVEMLYPGGVMFDVEKLVFSILQQLFFRLNESMTPVIVEITSSAIALFRARQVCIDKYIGQWENETLEHGKAFSE